MLRNEGSEPIVEESKSYLHHDCQRDRSKVSTRHEHLTYVRRDNFRHENENENTHTCEN